MAYVLLLQKADGDRGHGDDSGAESWFGVGLEVAGVHPWREVSRLPGGGEGGRLHRAEPKHDMRDFMVSEAECAEVFAAHQRL
jgi:hypothetical protein